MLFIVVLLFVLVELGDKIMLVMVILVSDYYWVGVWIGIILGMILVDGLVIGVGLLLYWCFLEWLL